MTISGALAGRGDVSVLNILLQEPDMIAFASFIKVFTTRLILDDYFDSMLKTAELVKNCFFPEKYGVNWTVCLQTLGKRRTG